MYNKTFNDYDNYFINLDFVEKNNYIYICEQMLHNYGI